MTQHTFNHPDENGPMNADQELVEAPAQAVAPRYNDRQERKDLGYHG